MYTILLLVAALTPSLQADKNYYQFPMPIYSTALTRAVIEIINVFFALDNPTLSVTVRAETQANYIFHQGLLNEILLQVAPNIVVLIEDVDHMTITHPRFDNLMIIDSWESFLKIYQHMTSDHFDYKGYYVIVLTTQISNQQQIIRLMFACMWRLHIVNVNIMMQVSHKEKAVIYTNYPFTRFHCEGVYPVVLNQFEDDHFVDPTLPIFPDKLRNFHKCPLKVATFNNPPYMMLEQKNGTYSYDGIEGILLRVLAEQLNFTPYIVVPDNKSEWGAAGNKTTPPTGAIGLIMQEKVNFTLAFFGSTVERHNAMKSSVVYFTTSLVMIVPPGREHSPFQKLFLPFKYIIWSCITTIFGIAIVTTVLCKCQRRTVRNFLVGRANQTPLLNTINVFFGGSLPRLPRRNFARTMLGIWLLYCFIIRSTYQAKSFQFMQNSVQLPIANTFDEMVAEDYHFYINIAAKTYFENMPRVEERMVIVERTAMEYYYQQLQYPDFKGALVSSVLHVAYRNKINPNKAMLHTAAEKLFTFQISMFFPKSSCLISKFDIVILDLVTNGLIKSWSDTIIPNTYRRSRDAEETKEPQKLTLFQLRGTYKLYGAAMGVSFIVFLLELLSKRIRVIRKLIDYWQRQQ